MAKGTKKMVANVDLSYKDGDTTHYAFGNTEFEVDQEQAYYLRGDNDHGTARTLGSRSASRQAFRTEEQRGAYSEGVQYASFVEEEDEEQYQKDVAAASDEAAKDFDVEQSNEALGKNFDPSFGMKGPDAHTSNAMPAEGGQGGQSSSGSSSSKSSESDSAKDSK